MTSIGGELIILNDREPVPPGSVTFGQLITEARTEKRAERQLSKREKWHLKLYARHVRRFRLDLPLIVWERHVCRIGDEHAAWFDGQTPLARMDLCDYSRAMRRKQIVYTNPWAENDAIAYSGL